MVWFGLAWLGLAWLGWAWLGLAWLGLAWLGLVWFGLVWFWFWFWFGLVGGLWQVCGGCLLPFDHPTEPGTQPPASHPPATSNQQPTTNQPSPCCIESGLPLLAWLVGWLVGWLVAWRGLVGGWSGRVVAACSLFAHPTKPENRHVPPATRHEPTYHEPIKPLA